MRKKFLVKIVVIPRSRVETEQIMEKHVTARAAMTHRADFYLFLKNSIIFGFWHFKRWFFTFQIIINAKCATYASRLLNIPVSIRTSRDSRAAQIIKTSEFGDISRIIYS